MPVRRRAATTSVITVLGTAVFAALLAAGPARAADAAPAPSAAKLNDEGFTYFKERDFRRAVEKFLQAYALEPDANLLFNIARCYDALGDTAAAAEKYRLFLAQPDADAEGKRRAQEALRLLEEKRAQPAASGAVAAPPAAPAVASAPSAAMVAQAPAAPPPNASAGRTGRIALVGVGITGVFIGTTLLVLGKQDYDKVRSSPNFGSATGVDPMTEPQARALLDSGQNKQIVGSVILGVGVVALVTSVVLIARAGSAEGHSVAMGVAPEQGGANLVVQGRF